MKKHLSSRCFALSLLLGLFSSSSASASVYVSNTTSDWLITLTINEEFDAGDAGYWSEWITVYLYPGDFINLDDYYSYPYQVTYSVAYEDWLYIGQGGGGSGPPPPSVDHLAVSIGGGSWSELSYESGTSFRFRNMGAQTVTFSAKDNFGNTLGGVGSTMEWHVTENYTGNVHHNWSVQPNITLTDLWLNQSFTILARTLGGSHPTYRADVTFSNSAGSSHPDKIQDSTSFPYNGERVATCAIACLRNIIYHKVNKNQSLVPSEDWIINELYLHKGKSLSDWTNPGFQGGLGYDQTEDMASHILNPYGLVVTRQPAMSREQLKTLLENHVGAIMISVNLVVPLPNGSFTIGNHMILIYRGTDGYYYRHDPNETKAIRMTSEEAANKLKYLGSATTSDAIWTVNVPQIQPEP